MRGIILAGGTATRLHPITQVISKQLLPVYDKPMIYYPLTTLMLAGVREILLISTPSDLPQFQRLLGDGSQFGLALQYADQPRPGGLAQALLIGADFLKNQPSILILGDNIFYGPDLSRLVRAAASRNHGATVFAYQVEDPHRYGVATFDESGRVTAIAEKPELPQSNWAVTGLYIYDKDAPRLAAELKPSARGELEITDLNRTYLARGMLRVEQLGRGFAWFDAGTPESLIGAAEFVRNIERSHKCLIACPEGVAFSHGWISSADLRRQSMVLAKSDYGKSLLQLNYDVNERNPKVVVPPLTPGPCSLDRPL
jgi:glucose-1-phosphate thymidylyltransferase